MALRYLLPLLLCTTVAHAQYTIPDPALVTALQGIVPQAMSANVLDTTHASVLSLEALDLEFTDVIDMDGLRFFTGLDSLNVRYTNVTTLTDLPAGLKWLNCGGLDITSLPNALPAGLGSLICVYSELNTLPSTLPSTLLHLDASGNALTSTGPLPASLRYLDLASNDLVSMQEIPADLVELRLQSNSLTTLPPLPSGLVILHAVDNTLTSLPALPASLQILALSYNELVTLPELPASLIELYTPSNQLTSLPALPNALRKLSTMANELTSLPDLPDSLRFLHATYNQLTSIPELPDSLLLFGCSGNQITELPALPAGLQELYCNANPIACLPALPNSLIDLVTSATEITCLPNIPTNAVLNTADLGFAPIICAPSSDCFLPHTISGTLFLDTDGDAIMDEDEPIIPHGTVEAQPGSYIGGADTSGRFAIPVEPGTYTVQGQPRTYHTITTAPQEVIINLGSSDTSAYIGYLPIPGIHDLVADIQAGVARPGFENLAYLSVTNNGTETSEASISLYIDAQQSYIASTLEPTFQSGTFVTWSTTLAPGHAWSTTVTLYTAADIALGTGLMHMITAEPLDIDTVPEDNTAKWEDEVVGSYDPNDKRPSTETLTPEEVDNSAWLDYNVRFQNTGTFLAENVVISDTLSTMLQEHSITFVSASHNVQWVLGGGVLTFSFHNIQLPDSASDPVGSQGYVHFRLKVQPDLLLGDAIVNVANIYFDFNEPIITAPAITVIEEATGITSRAGAQDPRLTIAPNPAQDRAVLHHAIPNGSAGVFTVHDVMGKVIFSTTVPGGTQRFPFSTAQLNEGCYYYVVTVGPEKMGAGRFNVVR